MFVERAFAAIHKAGEELCGDHVFLTETADSVIAVLSDGLGSGVKANILATITTKIIGTMLRGGAHLDEVVQTLARTLPTCQVRNLAYSTFTIVQIFADGQVYLAEFDNPAAIYIRQGTPVPIPRRTRTIGKLTVQEAYWKAGLGDVLVAVSDGVTHSGIGRGLDFGWLPDKVASFAAGLSRQGASSQRICAKILEQAKTLQEGDADDDTSVMAMRLRNRRTLTAAIGPPKDVHGDELMAQKLAAEPQRRIVCGGTTAQIIGRQWKQTVAVDCADILAAESDSVPPTAQLNGVHLVTEGIITLVNTLDCIKQEKMPPADNGAGRLVQELLRADQITFLVGGAINPAHQNPALPLPYSLKQQVMQELTDILTKKGKVVELQLF